MRKVAVRLHHKVENLVSYTKSKPCRQQITIMFHQMPHVMIGNNFSNLECSPSPSTAKPFQRSRNRKEFYSLSEVISWVVIWERRNACEYQWGARKCRLTMHVRKGREKIQSKKQGVLMIPRRTDIWLSGRNRTEAK